MPFVANWASTWANQPQTRLFQTSLTAMALMELMESLTWSTATRGRQPERQAARRQNEAAAAAAGADLPLRSIHLELETWLHV